MDAFTRVVNGARLTAGVEQRLFMVRLQGIGLHIDGRSSSFDMHYFPATEVMAVVARHDDRYAADVQQRGHTEAGSSTPLLHAGHSKEGGRVGVRGTVLLRCGVACVSSNGARCCLCV